MADTGSDRHLDQGWYRD